MENKKEPLQDRSYGNRRVQLLLKLPGRENRKSFFTVYRYIS
jgi:hypothetical protein